MSALSSQAELRLLLVPEGRQMHPIRWWQANEGEYPKLAQLAYMFSIPAMSAEHERIFSGTQTLSVTVGARWTWAGRGIDNASRAPCRPIIFVIQDSSHCFHRMDDIKVLGGPVTI